MNIEKFAEAFGFDKDKLSRIMDFHLTESNLLQGGFFDQIMKTLDRVKAKSTIEALENIELKLNRITQKAEKYLKNFILSGGNSFFSKHENPKNF